MVTSFTATWDYQRKKKIWRQTFGGKHVFKKRELKKIKRPFEIEQLKEKAVSLTRIWSGRRLHGLQSNSLHMLLFTPVQNTLNTGGENSAPAPEPKGRSGRPSEEEMRK